LKRIVLANLASPGNPGDFAILLGSLKLLREYFGQVSVTLVTRHFTEAAAYRELDCQVVPSYPDVEPLATDSRLKKILSLPRAFFSGNLMAEAIRTSDMVFLIGGGYFYSYRSLMPGLNYLSYCLPAYFAKCHKKPVILLSQSYGPLKSGLSRSLLGRTLESSELVFSREAVSLDWLRREYPADRDKYHFLPDLGLLLEPSDLNAGAASAGSARKKIGVTIRPWQAGGEGEEKYVQTLSEALAWAHDTLKSKIVIIVQVVRPTRGESDKAVSERLARELSGKIGEGNVELQIREPYFPVADLCRVYGECDFLIAMRLHSAILSFVMSRPALVVGYQHKAKGILEAMNLEDLFVNSFESVTAQQLRSACSKVSQDLEGNRKRVVQALEIARSQIRDTFKRRMTDLGL